MRAAVLLVALLLAPLASAEAGVRLAEGGFEPAEARVGTWEWVNWTWPADEARGIAPEGGGEAWCAPGPPPCRRYFTEPGEYRYHDATRPELAGVVIVERRGGDAGATLQPRFLLSVVEGTTIRFDATPTAQSRTAIASYAWEFGDGAEGTGRVVDHAYAAPGSYEVVFRVVDEFGREAVITRVVNVPRPIDPVARFNATANGRSVLFESTPWTGGHAWDFGDGERAVCDPECVVPLGTLASSPTSVLHVYRRGGVFNVTHQAWDANGTRNVTAPVSVDAEETFSLSRDGLTVEVDASHLPRYGNATFAWLFGDLARAEGPRANHTFPREGIWSVRLILADEVGTQQLDRESTLAPETAGEPAPERAREPQVVPSHGLLALALVLAALAALKSERYK